MNDLTIFNHKDFGNIRVASVDDAPWWVLRDICRVLGIKNVSDTSSRLDREEVDLVYILDPNGRRQKTTVVSESGLYSVILRSDKPEAKSFKRWVTREVLPAIRKTGSYLPPKMTTAEIVAHLAQSNVEFEKRIEAIEHKVDATLAVPAPTQVTPESWKDEMNATIKEVAMAKRYSPILFRARLYRELEDCERVNIAARQTKLRNRMAAQGYTLLKQSAITKLDAISKDRRLRAAFAGIVGQYKVIE